MRRTTPAGRSCARIIHATADFSFARSLRIHPEAVARGRAALAAGGPVLCDVKMLQAGMTKVRNEVVCAIGDPEAAALAARAAMHAGGGGHGIVRARLAGAIVAIGNAPTALGKLLEIVRGGGPRPALVVGVPVGLVGAGKRSWRFWKAICVTSPTSGARGGSPVAAAAVNALAALALKEERVS